MTTIKIIDAPMGAGKTTAIINRLKDHNLNTQERFIYITPYLSEVERLKENLCACNYHVPEDTNKKTQQVKTLIEKGESIITTHALLKGSEIAIADLIQSSPYSYQLIIDEEYPCCEACYKAGVKEGYPSLDEYQLLKENEWIKEDDTGLITWTTTKDTSVYQSFKTVCTTKDVYFFKNSYIVLTPKRMWESYASVTLLTYRFKYSSFGCYCDLHGFNTQYYHIEDGVIKEGYKESYPIGLNRILLYNDHTVKGTYDLSKAWYGKTENTAKIKTLRTKTTTFLKKFPCKTKLWCTFKSYEKAFISKNISAKDAIACNCHATNDYQDKTALAYLVNRFMNPFIKQFLEDHNVTIKEDEWALNELLQLIWRTNIRVPLNTQSNSNTEKDNTIHLFIPSSRMRKLLKDWIERGNTISHINKDNE